MRTAEAPPLQKGNLMALIRWEPVPMNRLINSFFDTPTAPSTSIARRYVPATDLVETETHYVLRADLPGVSESDISVDVENNVLTVRGERRNEHESTENGYRRLERSSGSFRRSVRLPRGVDADAISATFDRGVLEVSVPKPAQAQPTRVEVTVGAPAAAIEQETEAGAEAPAAS
jgi:HSP20 family protein